MKTKTINGLTFEISQPYAEGHVVTEAEAKALNQTRSENIGNNVRAKIKELQDKLAAGELDEATVQSEAAALVADADANYIFNLASVSASKKLDPYEKEALRIAKELVKEHLAADGRKVSQVPEGLTEDDWKAKLEEQYESIAANENVIKAAKKNVDAKRKQSEALVDAIGGLAV